MKKITSLFLSLLLVVSITSSYADHHEKSVEKEIQAALKAGKITEEEAKEKLAYLKRREAESKKIAKTKDSSAKKKAEQDAARKKSAAKKKATAKKKAEPKKSPAKKKADQEAT